MLLWVQDELYYDKFHANVDRIYRIANEYESSVKEIGWESPIGKQSKIVKKGTVIGVVKDFHFEALHSVIEPVALYIYPKLFGLII